MNELEAIQSVLRRAGCRFLSTTENPHGFKFVDLKGHTRCAQEINHVDGDLFREMIIAALTPSDEE